VPIVLSAQDRAADRRRFLKPTTPTTDDPRRIPIGPGPRGPDGSIVLKGGRVFDGTGAPAHPATVVIERNRITQILPPGTTGWPQDARVLDVTGMTVLPGLIDLHTHLTYSESPTAEPGLEGDRSDGTLRAIERLRFYVESGITSVRDVASMESVFRLKVWVRDRRLPGPRIFAAGQFITAPGGHSAEGMGSDPQHNDFRLASGADDWRKAVREQFDRGADLIKIGSHFSKEEVRAAVEEAHALGLMVTCDCETFYIEWAVDAGVDMIEHPLPRTDETIAKMAAKGTKADPTLIPYTMIFEDDGGYFGSSSRRFSFSQEDNLAMLKRLKQAGITLGIGTDLIYDKYRLLPKPYLAELKHFVQAGFTVPQVLGIATKTNAELLDMGDKLGTLESGKLADVLVVRGTPDSNLDDLTRVAWVIRDGEIVVQDGQALLPKHAPSAAPPRKRY
jgi:imidazolonepropionase-like amidohydrolase